MIYFKEKSYTVYDETDSIKRMRDSDILAQKRKTNTDLNTKVLHDTILGTGLGAVAGGLTGLRGGASFKGNTKYGAVLGGLTTAALSYARSGKKRRENSFYNDRLEYAQRHAKRRERADWRNNVLNRDGYTY